MFQTNTCINIIVLPSTESGLQIKTFDILTILHDLPCVAYHLNRYGSKRLELSCERAKIPAIEKGAERGAPREGEGKK